MELETVILTDFGTFRPSGLVQKRLSAVPLTKKWRYDLRYKGARRLQAVSDRYVRMIGRVAAIGSDAHR